MGLRLWVWEEALTSSPKLASLPAPPSTGTGPFLPMGPSVERHMRNEPPASIEVTFEGRTQ